MVYNEKYWKMWKCGINFVCYDAIKWNKARINGWIEERMLYCVCSIKVKRWIKECLIGLRILLSWNSGFPSLKTFETEIRRREEKKRGDRKERKLCDNKIFFFLCYIFRQFFFYIKLTKNPQTIELVSFFFSLFLSSLLFFFPRFFSSFSTYLYTSFFA